MGSTYFRDFHLVHRRLRIDKMVSLEERIQARERVEFNIPLSCIDLVMKSTSDALPELDLGKSPDFIWLDYESRPDGGVLSDIDQVIFNCSAASFLVVSVNAERGEEHVLQEWLSSAGRDLDATSLPIGRAEVASLCYEILAQRIEDGMLLRNAGSVVKDQVTFEQLLNVVYNDGTQMITFGGLLLANSTRQDFNACRLDELEYVRPAAEPFVVKVPKLTRREVHYLLRHLPKGGADAAAAGRAIGIPKSDVVSFASIYRYAPLFVEVDDW